MDSVKKHILESIGFIVGTSTDYSRMTKAEAEFRQHSEVFPMELDQAQVMSQQQVRLSQSSDRSGPQSGH